MIEDKEIEEIITEMQKLEISIKNARSELEKLGLKKEQLEKNNQSLQAGQFYKEESIYKIARLDTQFYKIVDVNLEKDIIDYYLFSMSHESLIKKHIIQPISEFYRETIFRKLTDKEILKLSNKWNETISYLSLIK